MSSIQSKSDEYIWYEKKHNYNIKKCTVIYGGYVMYIVFIIV